MAFTITEIISQYVTTLIENRYQICTDATSVHNINKHSNIFNCIKIPNISIHKYLQNLYSNFLFKGKNHSAYYDNYTKTEVACTHLLYFNFFLVQSEYELTKFNIHYLLCASFFHAYTIIIDKPISLKTYQPISGITLQDLIQLHHAFLTIIWSPKRLNFHFILSKKKIAALCLLLKQTFQHQPSLEQIIFLHQKMINLFCKELIFSPTIIDYQKEIILLFKEISLAIEILKSDRFNQETYGKFNLRYNTLINNSCMTYNFCPFSFYYANQLTKIKTLLIEYLPPSKISNISLTPPTSPHTPTIFSSSSSSLVPPSPTNYQK